MTIGTVFECVVTRHAIGSDCQMNLLSYSTRFSCSRPSDSFLYADFTGLICNLHDVQLDYFRIAYYSSRSGILRCGFRSGSLCL